jgi:hypothetical protein
LISTVLWRSWGAMVRTEKKQRTEDHRRSE